MTVEQMQTLLGTVKDVQNRLVSMMTALELAIELRDELAPEDHAQLVESWRQQLQALRILHTSLPSPTLPARRSRKRQAERAFA
jgi:hypothetical protein